MPFHSLGDLGRRLASFISLIIMAVVLSILSPYFLTFENIFAIGLQMSVIAVMAIGEMMIIISGGIDLSVGSILALSGVVCTSLMAQGFSMTAAVSGGIGVGIICGIINGVLISKGRIPPFIATLGMMGMARGAALIISGGAGVQLLELPESFIFLGAGRIFDLVPVPVVITLFLACLGYGILKYTRMGRYTYAIGSNPEAARLSGVNISRYLTLIYTFCGLLCGLAGVVLASRLRSGQPTAGTGWELDVIAACVIGGASLSGGEGTVLGAIVGAQIMGVLRNGCNLLDISAFWQQVAIGAIIVVAVFIDQYRHARE
ncbi:MAG TPA: ABC transporter permease [archaeon]|nr:ABC transporter permease [archaeon]